MQRRLAHPVDLEVDGMSLRLHGRSYARASFAVFALFSSSSTAGAGERKSEFCYTEEVIPPLGIPDEASDFFVDLDQSGRVLLTAAQGPFGESDDASEAFTRAYVWAGAEPQPIEVEGFAQTDGLALNERGEVLVRAAVETGAADEVVWGHAVVWKAGEVVATIPAPDGLSFDEGRINAHGHVALRSEYDYTSDTPVHAYLWRGDALADLGESELHDFNDADEVVGFDRAVPGYVVWRGTERRVLPTSCRSPVDSPDEARVNRHGRVAAAFECDSRQIGMTWAGDEALELPGEGVWIGDLNDHGDIVGSVVLEERRAPALWRDGELTVIPLPQGVEGGHIAEINEQGRFIGTFEIDFIPYFFVGDSDGAQQLSDQWGGVMVVGEINDAGVIVNAVAGDDGEFETTSIWRPCAVEGIRSGVINHKSGSRDG
ncbi:hypothetical protein [Nannocystis pusilla]|uniref:WG repeat-containing protein n=1 Tax=Nannocystis pusilla TaxID=889268 RepID=A0ABS7TPK1_9BACT|nr:hypothetical protein [Nannocystis pusilla]MBZ5710163.1 hypothetical protein [Nannocystis pusilla]